MSLYEDIPIKVIPTDKFKTTTITFKFMAPLDVESMTARSLLSKMLVRATKKYPTDKAFNQHLSYLYGAYLNSHVSKFKDHHVITMSLEIANERFLQDSLPLMDEGIHLLKEVILNPLVNEGAFDETFLQQEKRLLQNKLIAIEDNKTQLSYLHLLKNMFGDHPYSYPAVGQLEQIESITPEILYDTYRQMIEQDSCAVYVVGHVDENTTKDKIQAAFELKPFVYERDDTLQAVNPQQAINEVVEMADIDQAKLNMGFRFPTQYGAPDYPALIVFNMMFGGDPSSVLFNEVREKKSLAYSIHSQIDGKNGFLFVLSGVSSDAFDDAKNTIIEAFEQFKQGDFTEEKMALAKKIILSHRKELKDRPKQMIELTHNKILVDNPEPESSFVERIQAVTKEDIQQLCQKAQLDTIYIMTKAVDQGE
ncbi:MULTISPECIES: pitrilysin family protein [unclassified Staphylococcus]|uniref:EF-P 5-aminopentanol modification-associated protein YfmF n=1 Tax=unclassified Staphylococcus TaxID=91994 RepID=UPI0021D14ED6|nr:MULTISPECIES: pitrilysin family protein [unclassified Staphylococcus]UXR77496.1 insulinase family protein [Staphylococcus sp. IVB6227]UXR83362.1 insulinase family protein [Staphylococcus sp. IVB6214]